VGGTAWEVDHRPSQPCVVCRSAPNRRVMLPQLPDVHVAFASSAICDVCWTTAEHGDLGSLTERAGRGWPDDPDVVPDLIRLVLTAAGQPAPRKPVPPREWRDPAPQPLSAADAAVWAELEPLVFDGPDHEVVVRGTIEHVYDGKRSVTLVHLAGSRARLCEEDGQPWLLTDGVTMWRRSDAGMIASDYHGPAWAGNGSELAHHRSREEVEVFGFGRPIGPIQRTEYLDRPAWRFAFAAPAHKPYDMRVVIDAVTGLTLEQRFGEISLARWTEFVTGEPIDPAMFVWDGPVQTAESLRAESEREHEADMARRQTWFANNVTDEPLFHAGEPIEVLLHTWNDDGSFEASFDGGLDGAIARRPKSTEWWDLGWSEVTHRWSDNRWDWALSIWDENDPVGLDDAGLAALRRALRSTEPDR
jgi:hypothetical protein